MGYIPFEGRIGRKLSNVEKFYLEAKRANLQPVKKVCNVKGTVEQDYSKSYYSLIDCRDTYRSHHAVKYTMGIFPGKSYKEN
jgi:hypothetical protein